MKEAFVLLVYMISADGIVVDRTYPKPLFYTSREACEDFANRRNAMDASHDFREARKALEEGRAMRRLPQMIWACGEARMMVEPNVGR
jgi:hypothetical protein